MILIAEGSVGNVSGDGGVVDRLEPDFLDYLQLRGSH